MRTVDGWQEWSYGELDRRCARVAAALMAKGTGPGDRVALIGTSGPDWVAGLLGIFRAGGVAVPLDPGLTPSELAPVLRHTRPVAVIARGGVPPGLYEGAHLDLDDLGAGPGRAGDLDPPAAPAPASAGTSTDPALIVWTSGTTGRPKGVTLSHANLAYSVGSAVVAQSANLAERWLSVLPAHHLLELCCGVLPALCTGATVSFAGTLMPHEIVEIIREREVQSMMAVPLLVRILESRVAGSGLRTLYCGGAPLDPALVERYGDRGIAVYSGYGLTEAAPTVSMNTARHHRLGSVGRPLPGTEVRIDPPDGEIVVRSPGVMLGYWEDKARTAEAVDGDGWLRTGDLGHLDHDGFLHVTGRAKRLVVLESGKKVQPEEVEALLSESRWFAEACVVAVRAGATGREEVCAVVVPHAEVRARGLSPEALADEMRTEVARCTSPLSGYKRPTRIEVCEGPLPRTLKGTVRHDEVARVVELGSDAA